MPRNIIHDAPYYQEDSAETRMTLTALSDVGMPDQHLPLVRLAGSKRKLGWNVTYHTPFLGSYSFVYISVPMDQCSGADGFPDDVRTLLAGIPHECYYKYDSVRSLFHRARLGICLRLK